MPQQRLLYLDTNHLSALLWHGGTLHEEGHFAHDDAGVAAFSEYLAHHRRSNFRLLADVTDEGFQIETLPYTQGADRRALLARKLGQYFYGSPLSTAISCGREKTGRRDEKSGNRAKPARRRPMMVPATSAMCRPEIEMMW